ncbi:cilia- and flagella-associated protein 119-like [Rhinoderma darwinii]|uniref:cilia- and flagella-associated protein 119-like n=1 Tax=Rhinoderma darwinii TaxID=43563 RepID=UPI003F68047B
MIAETGNASPGDGGLCRVKISKSRVCLWKDVTVRDLERLERAQSAEDLRRTLSELLDLESGLCGPRAGALLDLYYYTVRFCRDCGYDVEQMSCVLSIVKETHAACVGSPLGNVSECHQLFRDLLLCHAVQRPPFSIGVFSPQQLLHILDYFVKTYFCHFKLYKWAFTPQVNLDLSIVSDVISEMNDAKTSDEAGAQETEDTAAPGAERSPYSAGEIQAAERRPEDPDGPGGRRIW